MPGRSLSDLPRAAFLLLGAAALPLCGCDGPSATPARAAGTDGAAKAVRVSTVKPTRGPLRRTVEQPAQVEAAQSAAVFARIGGYVASVHVDIGDRVKRGEVLASIDAPEAAAEAERTAALVGQAEAELELARASVEVEKSRIASAEAAVEEVKATSRRMEADAARWQAESARIDQLARESAVTASLRDETRSKLESSRGALDEAKARGISAQAARGEAHAGLDKARAEVDAASARIAVAKAAARGARAAAGFATIFAPFDGVVTRRDVDAGRLATAGTAAPPLFVIEQSDHVTVVAAVPESEAGPVGPGDAARVTFPALANRVVEGKVARTGTSLDPSTRTLRVEIDLLNPDSTLRPGQYAHAAVVTDERPDALTLPLTAIVRDTGAPECVVVNDGKARRRGLRLGLSDGTRVEVVSGLEKTDSVVVTNAEGLAAGQSVDATPAALPPAAKP